MTWIEAEGTAMAGTPVRRLAWEYWLTFERGLWFKVDGASKNVIQAPQFRTEEFGASDWTIEPWTDGGDVCSREAPRRPALLPHPTFTPCYVGDSGNCTTIRAFRKEGGFPVSPSGALPRFFSGADLTGITQLGGSDIISTGSYLVRAGTGNVNAYDNAVMVFGIARADFEFSYQFFLESGFPGKHWLAINGTETLDSHYVGTGEWDNWGGFGVPLLHIGSQQTTGNIHTELPPEEIPSFPDLEEEWRTRVIRKRGSVIWVKDGAADWIRIERCWLAVTGWLGMVIGPGVRVREIRITELDM